MNTHGFGARPKPKLLLAACLACLPPISTCGPDCVAAAELLQIKIIQKLWLVYCFLSFSDGKTSQHSSTVESLHPPPWKAVPTHVLEKSKLKPRGTEQMKMGICIELHLAFANKQHIGTGIFILSLHYVNFRTAVVQKYSPVTWILLHLATRYCSSRCTGRHSAAAW